MEHKWQVVIGNRPVGRSTSYANAKAWERLLKAHFPNDEVKMMWA